MRVLLILVIAFSAVLSVPIACHRNDKTSADTLNPVAIEGEMFLDGADEERVVFSRGQELAKPVWNIIQAGKPSLDRKDQGLAAFTIRFDSGADVHVELTNTGLTRVGGNPVKVDLQRLLRLLRPVFDAGKKGDGDR